MVTKDAQRPRARWLRRALRWIALAGVVAILIAAGGRWFVGHQTYACLRCHGPDDGHLREHAHRGMNCGACHDTSLPRVARVYALRVLPGRHEDKDHAPPNRRHCRDCHSSSAEGLRPLAETRGHQVHVLGKPNLECTECHGGGMRVVRPDPGACTRCHSKLKVFSPGMAGISCTSCHDFLASTTAGRTAPPTDCQRCHADPKHPRPARPGAITQAASPVTQEMVHGNVAACALCHNPHRASAEERSSGENCSRCHAKLNRQRMEEGDPNHPRCSTCHKPHDQRVALVRVCDRCHEQKPPKATARPTLSSRHERCTTCHRFHRLKSEQVECASCHQKQRDVLASWSPKSHAACTSCHAPHQEKSPADACLGCHQDHSGHRHNGCTTCHDPHGNRGAAKSCASCHKSPEFVTLVSASPHKGGCANCHTTHQMGRTSERCARCHAKQASLVSSAPASRHQTCSSCHKPHTFAASTAACTSCHQQKAGGAHGNDCRKCHTAHGNPVADINACSGCHRDVPRGGGKHQTCTSCHSAHQPAASARCERCHAGNAAGVAAWPAAAHKTCASCHLTHQPTTPKSCPTCHARQASQLSPSRHQCRSCHSVHQAPTSGWSQCANCHRAEQASLASAPGPTHSQCKNCHTQAHAVVAGSCRSCHAQLPGAHADRGHRRCADCHGQHATGMPKRETCLKCHQKQVNHQPNATRCSVCHLFQ
jgi:hypothetical protein